MSEIKVNTTLLGLKDVKLHVTDTGGSGEPIVLIHGWPLSSKSWFKQIPALTAAGFRVITYDRRGFGQSDKPLTGYSYDTLADDLAGIIDSLQLNDVTLIGFSMGGGEVARYVAKHGESRLKRVVFASAVTPMMLKTPGNPEGPLTPTKATSMTASLTANSDKFYDQFTKEFFSPNADGHVLVTEQERQDALAQCKEASKIAALEAMQSFGISDFRDDLKKISLPTLVIHGSADGIVPFEGSGQRAHKAVPQSELKVIAGGPHGINISHADEFNAAVLRFLKK